MATAIPDARNFIQVQETKGKRTQQIQATHQAKWLSRLSTAVNEFTEQVVKLLCERITKALNSGSGTKRVDLWIINLGLFQGLPWDVLLYGHRGESWYDRRPLEIGGPTTFELLQMAFYRSHWYLVEESDPDISHAVVFCLYPQPPPSTHKYFNAPNRLWHGHNMFDEEKIIGLIATEDKKTSAEVKACAGDEEALEQHLDAIANGPRKDYHPNTDGTSNSTALDPPNTPNMDS